MKIFLSFVLGSFFTLIVMNLFFTPDYPNHSAATSKPVDSMLNSQDLLSKIDQLESDNMRLIEALKSAEQRLSHQPNLAPNSVPPGKTTTQTHADEAAKKIAQTSTDRLKKLERIAAESQAKALEDHIQKVTDDFSKPVFQSLDDTFLSEPTDSRWAFEQQSQIDAAFEDNALLNGFSLVASECRSTQCKVSLLTPMEEGASSFDIFNEVNQQGHWKSFISAVDPETGVTQLYFQKNEHGE